MRIRPGHIFHGPVSLSYMLKTMWCMNMITRDNKSV